MIGTYDHPYFRKLSVWQGTSAAEDSGSPQQRLKSGGSPGARGRQQQRQSRGMASKMADANDSAARERRGSGQHMVGDGGRDGASGEGGGGGGGGGGAVDVLGTEGQTYLIFQHPSHQEGGGEVGGESGAGERESTTNESENMSESTRPAFFRFGGWCYGGNVVVRHGVGEMSLSSLVDVLPTLGEQQRQMSFSTELERLPEASRQYSALKRLQQASEYLLEQLQAAENELNKLKKFLEKRGQQAWVDDESRNVYFELQLSTEGAAPLACVEVAASKIHVSGVLLSTMYFGGTLYATVSSGSTGENALLDSSFPDVTTKGRGYTIGATPHSYYKKFAVWEGNVSGNLVGNTSSPKSRSSGRGGPSEPALSDGGSSPGSGRNDGGNVNEKGGNVVEGKRGDSRDGDAHEREAASFGGKTSDGNGNGGGSGGIGPLKTSGRRLAPLRKEIGPVKTAGRRLAPLGESFANRGSNFGGLQPLKKLGADSPWDAMGRPKLGAIGSGGGNGGDRPSPIPAHNKK